MRVPVHGKSVLRAIPCDLERLPIAALERFVLSQMRGGALAEDVAEATGLEVNELLRVARHLAELGAISVDGETRKTKRPTMAPKSRHTLAPKDRPTLAPKRRSVVPAKDRATVAPKGRTTAAPKARSTMAPKQQASTVPKHRATVRPDRVEPLEASVSPKLVPAARPHADLRSLGIGPREAFVLAQIDGKTSVEDLGEVTSLSPAELRVALLTLEQAGAVDLGPPKSRPSTVRPSPALEPPARRTPAPPRAPAPEADVCSLSDAEGASILETAARLEALDLYGVLGVERDADAKAIRRAYHALAAQHHPDRWFGKKLGALRKPIERTFARLTFAYDTLSRRSARAEYDARHPPPRPPQKQPSKRPTKKSLRALEAVRAAPPAAAAPLPPPSPPPPPPLSPSPSPSPPSPPPPPLDTAASRTPQERIAVFVNAAKEALARDDLVGAANHYRLAVQCNGDPALRLVLDQVEAMARARVRSTSLAAAQAAEKAQRWADAGRAYAKAYGAQADAWVAERAANAIRHGGGDLREAARLAQAAVLAEPNNGSFRVTLGEVYFAAGLLARAAGEAARATAIAPDDVRAISLAKRIAKAKPSA